MLHGMEKKRTSAGGLFSGAPKLQNHRSQGHGCGAAARRGRRIALARKRREAGSSVMTLLILSLLAGIIANRSAAAAGDKPLIWSDAASGFAIGGFDPLAYFLKGGPERPQNALEARWGGAYWRFANIGNRAAFLAHPEIYAPQFGGFDPYLLTRHKTVRGNPVIFAIHENRLYLFNSLDSRAKWRRHKRAYIIQAGFVWRERAAREAGLAVAHFPPDANRQK
jgi:hypothetical protein